MSNPLLTESRFAPASPPTAWPEAQQAGWGAPVPPSGEPVSAWPPAGPTGPIGADTLTRGGVAGRTAILFALMCVTAALGWSAVGTETTQEIVDGVLTDVTRVTSIPWWGFVGPLVGLVLVLVTVFKPEIARFTAPVYALAQGVFVGVVSKVFETQFEGIVAQAILLTFGVFGVMLALYASGRIRVTSRFRIVVIAATLGICLVYLVSFIFSLFGSGVPYIHGSGPVGIAFSLLVVGIAALNLALDFDFVDRAQAAGAPKVLEWFAALGLMITLIWLYLEILKLLAKLRQR